MEMVSMFILIKNLPVPAVAVHLTGNESGDPDQLRASETGTVCFDGGTRLS